MAITNLAAIVATQGLIDHSTPKSDRVMLVQLLLLKAGAELVPDGEFGRVTEQAVARFQAAHGLHPVGYVGRKTAEALDLVGLGPATSPPLAPQPSVKAVAPHLATMRAITGTKELPGAADSPIILSWNGVIAKAAPDLAAYSKTYTHDSIPWCGLCVAYVLAANGLHPVKDYLWAANWAGPSPYLEQLHKPIPGAVLTFKRPGGSHVSLYEATKNGRYVIRGGNQSDMVNLSSHDMDSLIGITWPKGVPIPTDVIPVNVAALNAVHVSGKES